MSKKYHIAIIGAGVSGLSTAYFLIRNGHQVTIFERAPEIQNAGMSFIVLDNGYQILRKIFSDSELEAFMMPLHSYHKLDFSGIEEYHHYLNDCYCSTRFNLINALISKLPEGTLQTDKWLVDIKGNKAFFEDKSEFEFDILLGADGVKSKVKELTFGVPAYKEIREQEIVCRFENVELAQRIGTRFLKYHNPAGGFNFGVMKTSNTEVVWYCQIDREKYSFSFYDQALLQKELLNSIGKADSFLIKILESSENDLKFLWNIFEFPLLPFFHRDNVCLIGDAAHPVFTFTSQGVSLALEDAWILSTELEKYSHYHLAFKAFELAQKPKYVMLNAQGKELLENFLDPSKIVQKKVPLAFK